MHFIIITDFVWRMFSCDAHAILFHLILIESPSKYNKIANHRKYNLMCEMEMEL